jgi:hypothetical protein
VVTGHLVTHFLRTGQVGSCYSKSHCSLASGLCLLSGPSGFQDGCRVTEGENDSEQRTQIQNGGWDALLFFLPK